MLKSTTPTHTRDKSLQFSTINKSRSSYQPIKIIPNKVYITQARKEVQMPQGFDQNPQYVDMYQNQLKAQNYVKNIGIINDNATEANERNSVIREQYNRILEEQKQMHIADEKRHDKMIKQRLRQEQFEMERMRQSTLRKYQQTLKKIKFEEPSQDYYQNIPIKPGQEFYSQLLANHKNPPTSLTLNIPDMLVIQEDVFWVNTNKDTGKVQVRSEFTSLEFYQTIIPYTPTNNDKIVAIWRMRQQQHQDWQFQPLNWLKFSDKVLKGDLPSSSVIFKLIPYYSDKPTITRIFYQNQSRTGKSNYGYSITSSKRAMKTSKLAQQVICVDIVNGVDVFKLTSEAVKQYQKQCLQIVNFLQVTYKVIIEEIVLDFTKGQDGKIWLFGCEGLRLNDNALAAQRLIDSNISGLYEKEKNEYLKTQKELRLSAMHCKLCLLYFKSFEIQKMLPFKMLLLYKQHTKRSGRNILDLSHLRVLSVDFLSQWVRICDICYALVLSEYELMEVEQKLSKILNVPIKDDDLLQKPFFEHPAYMPDLMNQWRLLFYFQAAKFYDSRLLKTELYLHYKIFDKLYCYKLESKAQSGNYKEYKLPRLYYFFGQKEFKYQYFCETTEMELRITNGPDWDNLVAQTITKPLSLFSGKMMENTAYIQPLFLTFFHQKQQKLKFKIGVGLSCDKQIKARQLPINIRRFKGLYFPEEWYINSDTLPSAWMEVFDKKYAAINSTQILDTSQEFEELYQPQLLQEEILSKILGCTRVLHLNVELNPLKVNKKQKDSTQLPLNKSQTPTQMTQKSQSLQKMPKIKRNSQTLSYQGSTKSTCQVIYQSKRNKIQTPTLMINRPQTAQLSKSFDFSELNATAITTPRLTLTERSEGIHKMNNRVDEYLSKKQKYQETYLNNHQKTSKKQSKTESDYKPHWFINDIFSISTQKQNEDSVKRKINKLLNVKAISNRQIKKQRLKLIKLTYKSHEKLLKKKVHPKTTRY